MAGFVRENIYRLQINMEWQERQFLCMEFVGYTGAPGVGAWIETEVPREYDENLGDWIDAHRVQGEKVWVYGREILEKKRVTAGDMAVYWACDVLAKEAVFSTEATSLVQLVLMEWFVNGPKTRTKVLRAAAPDWWERLTRNENT